MVKQKEKFARILVQSKAIKLDPANPFTWASGWKSPIYCDNRVTLSYPDTRAEIKEQFAAIIREKYPECELVAGVATGAIAQGVLVAEVLGLPFVYIRSSAKGHGMENLIEGRYEKGQKAVIIEDLVSTGGSSLKAAEALRNADVEVLGMVAIFTYGFPVAKANFEKAGISLDTLSDYDSLLKEALASGSIRPGDLPILQEWRKDPERWKGPGKQASDED